MHDNVGGKIKGFAQVIAWLGIGFSVLAGLFLVSQGNAMRQGGEVVTALGVGVIFIGSLFSWILSLFAYATGELVEKTTEIAQNTAKDAPSGSSAGRMETLISWKESNLISAEEFELKKQELLKGN